MCKYESVGKVIYRELCKRLQFNHSDPANQWYIPKPGSVLENKTLEILCDFDIQTDHLVLARRLDLVLKYKKERNYLLVDFAILMNHKMKIKEKEKINRY